MPNWTYNDVTISGPTESIKAIKRKLEGETAFDFDRLVPMPKGLNIQPGSPTDLGMACLDRQSFANLASTPDFRAEYPGVTTRAQLRKIVAARAPRALTLGEQALENIERHGAPTWYEWRNKHWGTKWNAHNAEMAIDEPTRLSYQFETAWSAPYPLAATVRQLCDELGLTLEWEALDEDEPDSPYDVLAGEPEHPSRA